MLNFIKKLFRKSNSETPVELCKHGFSSVWPLTYNIMNNGFIVKQEHIHKANTHSDNEIHLFAGGASYIKL